MKEIIVIRHGDKNGDELTSEGVQTCNELAEHVDLLNYAYASERHRAVQTARLVSKLPVNIDARANVPAFPDSELERLAETQKNHPLGIIGAIWENASLINDAREAGVRMLGLVEEILRGLADGERALIVSHDGTMIGLEKILKKESFDSVDHSFGPLEGFRVDQTLHITPYP
jgi:broad specificity phosphatase PhoE